jgi:hypothetical protein
MIGEVTFLALLPLAVAYCSQQRLPHCLTAALRAVLCLRQDPCVYWW